MERIANFFGGALIMIGVSACVGQVLFGMPLAAI